MPQTPKPAATENRSSETDNSRLVLDPDFPPLDLINRHYTTAPAPGEAPDAKNRKEKLQRKKAARSS